MSYKIQSQTETKADNGIAHPKNQMTSNFLSVISTSLLTKEIGFSVVAALGGLIVLIGLWMEYVSTDEKRYESVDIKGFRKLKSKEKRGEKWVMAGIGIEIIVAVTFAALDVREKHDINGQAEANAPRNQPISEMSATAVLIVKGTDFNDLTNWDSRRVSRITLCKDDIMHIPNFDPLDAESFSRNDHKNIFDSVNRQYGIRFSSFPFMAGMGVEMPVKAIDEVNLLRVEINFLPHGSEISDGGVILRVNNSTKMFKFLPQTDTNLPYGIPSGMPGFPYVAIATNLDHIPMK
jgi:hypothetical protein